ncbi:hypothetical protein [Streptomyces thermolilacinus]|uniref:hypothetical protein n=1 Tax=Streptomyces thermolilacinus TaxID=285540 RepID=UPI0003C75C5B|nr:hypothetical protein [Streptomyces thermolilacinus]
MTPSVPVPTTPPAPAPAPPALPAPPAPRPPGPWQSAGPSPRPLPLPGYRSLRRQQADSGPSMVSLILLLTAPAVFAAAVLRPRSR